MLTFFSASTYEVLIFLAAGVILIPYLWAALFQLKTALKAERITQGKSLTYERVIGALAVIYAIWLLYAGRDYILPSAAVYLVLIPLFIKARREAGDTTLFKPFDMGRAGCAGADDRGLHRAGCDGDLRLLGRTSRVGESLWGSSGD
ncbi:MAG: hypothetical protein V9G09_06410 [Candidatus Nanopelagicales bacterium]